MSTNQMNLVSAGLLFLLVFLFGFWLSRSGKPYNMAIFTIHKLVAIGAAVFLALMISRVHQSIPLTPMQIMMIGITALCFLATVISGALSSIDKAMPLIVLRIHQITPYLTLLSTSLMLSILLTKSNELIKP